MTPEPRPLTCPSCTAAVDYDGRSETIRCDYCGTTLIVPEALRAATTVPGIIGDEDPDVSARIHEILILIQHGRKIEAIKLYRETFGGSLQEAKTAVDSLEHGQPLTIQVSPATLASTTAATTGCSCLMPLLIGLLVLGALVAAYIYSEGPESLERLSQTLVEGDFEEIAGEVESAVASANVAVNGQAVVASSAAGGEAAELLLETWHYGGSDISVRLSHTAVSGGERQVSWVHDLGQSGDGRDYAVGVGERVIYLAQGSSLTALDKRGGEPQWETVLSDDVPLRCPSCIRPVGDQVIVLTKDNVLEAFAADTGRSAWQVRLQSAQTANAEEGHVAFAILNDRVAVIDDDEDDIRLRNALYLYDINSGELVHRLAPRCSDLQNFFDDELLDRRSQIFVNEGNGDIFFLFGTSFSRQLCFQQWDSVTGEMVWAERLPENVQRASQVNGGIFRTGGRSPEVTLSDTALWITAETGDARVGVIEIRLADGVLTAVAEDPDYRLAPIGRQGDTLLVRAERQRGSSRAEIWGVDANTGERRWSEVLQAEHLFESEPFDDRYSVQLQADGVVVLQLLTEAAPANLRVLKLAAADGTLLYETDNQIADAAFWSGLTWTPDHAYVVLRSLYEIDLETGTAPRSWP